MTMTPVAVKTPTGIQMVGCFFENGLKRQEIEGTIEKVAKAIGIQTSALTSHSSYGTVTSIIAREEVKDEATTYQPVIKTLLGPDYCVHMLFFSARDDNYSAPLSEVMEKLKGVNLDAVLSDLPIQFSVQAYTFREILSPYSQEMIPALFTDEHFPSAMCRFQGLSVPLDCIYWSDLNRFILIPVSPPDTSLPATSTGQDRVISQVVDDLARLEVYYHKLHLSHQHYRKHYGRIQTLEGRVNDHINQARRDLQQAKTSQLWHTLDQISELFVDLSQLTYATQYSRYAANTNRINLERQLQDWAEIPVAGYATLSHTFLPEAHQIASTLDQFSKRIAAVRGELDGLVQVIRTRIELGQQQELVKMQHGMNVLEFLVLAGILLPFSQELSPLLEQVWTKRLPAWLPAYGNWLPIVISIILAFLLLLILVPLIDWMQNRRRG